MNGEEFLFGMRPECIFLRTQLGDKNPFLRTVHASSLPTHFSQNRSGRIWDPRDFDSFPEIYWQLRSDSIRHPEDLEDDLIDRDLYRLKQATSLKLTTFDRALLQEPFKNWRDKTGDLLFYPLGRPQTWRKKKPTVSTDLDTDAKNKLAGPSTRESSTSAKTRLEIRARPIGRGRFQEISGGNSEQVNWKNDAASEGSDIMGDASDFCHVQSCGYNLTTDVMVQKRDEKRRGTLGTFPSCRTKQSEQIREVREPSIISVELNLNGKEDPYKRRHQSPANCVISDPLLQKPRIIPKASSVKSIKRREHSASIKTPITTLNDTDIHPEDESLLVTQDLKEENFSDKIKGCERDIKKEKKSSSLKTINIQVFHERLHGRPISKTDIERQTETLNYKLDMLNYPPTKWQHASKSAHAGPRHRSADRDATKSTSKSATKIRKSTRASRSANNAYLTIMPCFV